MTTNDTGHESQPTPTSVKLPQVSHLITDIALFVEHVLFTGRWTLALFNIGLMAGLVAYTGKFLCEAFELCALLPNIAHTHETEILIKVLNLVDMAMVANLVVMVGIGNHLIFIRRMTQFDPKVKPQWAEGISPSTMKIKLSMSLVTISSVFLLKSFFEIGQVGWEVLAKQVGIHLVFIISTMAMAWVYAKSHSVDHGPTSPDHHAHSADNSSHQSSHVTEDKTHA